MRYSSSTDFHRVEARGWPGRIIFMCVVRIIRKEMRNKRCATSSKKVESEQRTARERLIIPIVVKRSIGVVILYSLARNQCDRPSVPFDDWLRHDKIWSGDESSLRGTAPGYSRRKEWNGRYVSPKSDLHRTWLSRSGRSPCRSHLAARRSYDVFLWDGPWFHLLGMCLGMCRQNIGERVSAVGEEKIIAELQYFPPLSGSTVLNFPIYRRTESNVKRNSVESHRETCQE